MKGKRFFRLMLAAAAAVSVALLPGVGQECVKAAAKKAVVSVERFSLGQGYLIEPEQVTFTQGETFAQVFDRLMKKHGYTYTADGTLTSGFYLRSINRADTGRLNIPACIQRMPGTVWSGVSISAPTNTKNTGNLEFPALGEFAYSSQSGWYYFVNNIAPNVGFSGTTVKDKDVIRVQFTVYGLGADLGAGYSEGALTALKHPVRDSITRKLADVKTKKEYQVNPAWKNTYKQAVSVVSNLDSTQAQITAAAKKLNQLTANTPKKAVLKAVKKSGKNKAKITWKKVSGCSGYQVYRSTKASSGFKKIAAAGKNKVSCTVSGQKKGKT